MENQDSEPLFGDDVYSLLRDDSLLHRTGSNNFASLIESIETGGAGNSLHQVQRQQNGHQNQHIQPVQKNVVVFQQEEQPMENPQYLQQEQQDIKQETKYQALNMDGPTLQQQQQPQPQEIKSEQCIVYHIQDYSAGKIVLISNDSSPSVSNEQQVQPQEQQPLSVAWDGVDDEDSVSEVQTTSENFVSNPSNSFKELLDEASFLPDTTARGVPSLQPWPGKYLFGISLPVDNKDRNKWCYSQELKKLYVCPGVAVPLNITMSRWIDASITITPVFHQSQYRMDPVVRCYNCKNANNCDPQLVDYIVQVDGEGCSYEVMQERPIVRVPVQPPSPGERSSILLLKLMCLTSCVGGPNRRPYCLVLTLRCNLTGMEIGRQILDVKCCKCPSRDMGNDATSNKTKLDEGQVTKIRKLSSQINVGQKRKKPKVKNEPGIETRYVNIAVPVEFELQVKSYVNGLIAEQILRRNQPNLLLYPEEDN
ncbi:cellular tumor antigen p53-like [Palaemon carinicauda]|uniref:cellular tumor antigen p53-like n=1 Tax=Palaemon carinicauda TaxID=392227 RepID=UPI0035B5FD72